MNVVIISCSVLHLLLSIMKILAQKIRLSSSSQKYTLLILVIPGKICLLCHKDEACDQGLLSFVNVPGNCYLKSRCKASRTMTQHIVSAQ